MRRWSGIVVGVVQLAAVGGLALALRSRTIPLGVKGDWEWLRVNQPADPLLVSLALVMVGVYAGYAALAMRSLTQKRGKAGWWLAGLVPLAILVQGAVQEGAPYGYGLSKWAIALHNRGSSGYYTVAKEQIPDLRQFLNDYPAWIKRQDSLHIGTHPPGLLMTSWWMLRFYEANPGLARAVVSIFPTSIDVAFRTVAPKSLPIADRAGLATTGFLILLACSATVVPLYILARRWSSPTAAWASAAIWPLVPSALMFQPAADTAFPLLSTTALALAAWSGRASWLATVAGIVLALGTQLSLVFFPVGFVAAIVYLSDTESVWKKRITLILTTGVGFVLTTLAVWLTTRANPFAIWLTNSVNHARFYVENPRRYWPWVLENPVELAIALGLPTVVCIARGLRTAPSVFWATAATLALLTLSGKNLSEVARLWLPLMPPLVVAAGTGSEKSGTAGLLVTLVLLGVQTLVLEATMQVVYPIAF
jgi:methylthioxylose transferase